MSLYLNSNNRVKWIDISKGIGILLVVFGHTGLPRFISLWIWSFHMPLFFLLSGFSVNYNKYPLFKIFIFKRAKQLMIPYLFFSLIVFLWSKIINYEKFELYFCELYTGWQSLALWFIPVLFITEIIYYTLKGNFTDVTVFILIVTITLTGFLFSVYNIHLIFKIEVAFTAIFYYYIGNTLIKHVIPQILRFKSNYLLIILFFILLTNIYMSTINKEGLDMAFNIIGDYRITYVNSLVGILFVLCISIFIERNLSHKNILFLVITFLGMNTFVILSTHQALLMTYKKIFFISNWDFFLSTLIRHILMWLSLCVIIKFINNKTPWLIGRSKN